MISRDVTLYFEFRFGNSWTVLVAQTIAYHQVPMFAFDVIRDAPEWDFESVEQNRKIQRDKDIWREMLIGIERNALDHALSVMKTGAICEKKSFDRRMAEFGYEVRR